MRMLGNIKTRNKLIVGFTAVLAVLAAVIVVALVQIVSIDSSQKELVNHDYVLSHHVTQISADVARIRVEVLTILLQGGDDDVRAAGETEIQARLTSVDSLYSQVKETLVRNGNSTTAAIEAELDELLPAYEQGVNQALALYAQGRLDDAQALVLGPQLERLTGIRADLLELNNHADENVATAVSSSQALLNTTILVVALLGALALIVVILVVWLLSRIIATPLRKVTLMIQDMSTGRMDQRLGMDRTDEVGLMAGAMDRLADTLQDLVRETNSLVGAAVKGNLAVRADADKQQGDFRKIVQGVNDTLDAVIGPLNVAAAHVERIANGEIPRPIAESYSGDFDILKINLNSMTDGLRHFHEELTNGLSVLASSSTEILATVSQLAAGAAETATAVTETSTTTEEVKQTAHLTAQKAKSVRDGAENTKTVSETGRKAVDDTVDGMTRISEQMELIADTVVRLSEQGQAISEIIATVNDIAEESNVLAVNAAIEATRAGEFGKGFAVVAQEMKSLAEQSRAATAQVRTILMEVQKATGAAVMTTEQGSKAVAAGVKQAAAAGDSIRVHTSVAHEAAQAAIQISASTDQQLLGLEQIASAIESIQQATVQNLAGTRQLEISARDLQDLGNRLKTMVEQQRVEQ